MLFYLVVFCRKEKEIEYCISNLVCVVYIDIYKIVCNIYAKKCLLAENMSIEWKCVYWLHIDRKCVYWIKRYLPKDIYWNVITLYIGYQKMIIDRKCVYWMKNVPINWKCVYWMKMCLQKGVYLNILTLHIRYTKKCLLTKKMSIGRKCVYWMKSCLLNKNVSIDWKCVCWKWKVTIVWYF